MATLVAALKARVKALLKGDPDASAAAVAVTWVCWAVTAISVVVRIVMYCKVRSLWLDEAYLAESIVTRSFRSLLAAPLANGQTAPALYLYVVKLLGALTGYSEGGLRVFSFFMFLGVLVLEYFLLTRTFNVGRAWTAFAICVTATLSIYMRYSNELKPYMGDAFFVLAVLFLYQLYHARKITLPAFVPICCLILLFSTPALFFVASVFICDFIFAVIARNRKQIIKTFCAGAIVLAFFIAYYVWWLMPVAERDAMVNFWKDNCFIFWPLNSATVKQDVKLILSMLGITGCLHFVFASAGFIASMIRKDKISCVVALSLLLLLVASSMEKYPLVNRLWLFAYVLEVIYMTVCFKSVKAVLFENRTLPLNHAFAVAAVIFVALNAKFVASVGAGLYLDTEETNPLVAYVQDAITDEESLYVYHAAIGAVRYKNGYDSDKIGDVKTDNIIWGKDRYEWGTLNQNNAMNEVNTIVAAGKAYLLFQHTEPGGGIEQGLQSLSALGYLHKIGEFHKTPLYYFTTDPNDPKRGETFDFGN